MIWHEKGRNCRGKGRNCRTPWPVPSRDSAPIAPQGRAAAAAAAVARPATLPRLLVAIMTCVGAPDLLSGGACRACSSWRAMARDQAGDWVALTFGRRTARLGHSNSRRTRTHKLVGILEVATKLAQGRSRPYHSLSLLMRTISCSSLM